MGSLAAIGVMAAGAGMSAQAYKASGKSAQALGNYNAEVAEVKADDAIARGRVSEGRHRLQTAKLIGDQRVAFAASGEDISDPDSTAVNVFADTAALSELDALTIRSNAAREAWGYRAQAKDDRFRGEVGKMEGDSKAIGAVMSTAGSVLYGKYGFGSTSRGRTATG